jgi:hypothetical protein
VRHPVRCVLRSSLAVSACAWATLICSLAFAAADAVPHDTNLIESLTPKQARNLVAQFKGGETVFIKGILGSRDALRLNDLRSLAADTAAVLATYRGPLVLNGLAELEPGVAAALGRFDGLLLSLDGLPTLSAETARALSASKVFMLSLNGLSTLTPDTARSLATFKGKWIVLSGLTDLSADAARALAEFRGEGVILDGLTVIPDDVARELAAFRCGAIHLDGLTSLPEGMATVVASFSPRSLRLNGLRSLSPEAAAAVAAYRGFSLQLNGLPTVTPAAARALADYKGDALEVSGLTHLSPEAAATFAGCANWWAELPRFTAFEAADSVAVAQALAAKKGKLAFPNLRRLSPKALEALLEKTDVELPPVASLEFIAERDGSTNDDVIVP